MIKVRAISEFTLAKYDEIEKSIIRKNRSEYGRIFKDDIFECTEEMAKYLGGENHLNKKVIEIIEIIPEVEAVVEFVKEEIEPKIEVKIKEEKPKKKTTRKKTTKK